MKKIIRISLIIFVFLLAGCEKYFFYPQKILYYMPETCKYDPENILVETDKGKLLHGWYFKTKVKNPKGTILFLHGNANNISTESVAMMWLVDKGYNVLTFDYRGYGISQGKPDIKGVLQDGLEYTEAVFKDNKVDKRNMVLYGQSLGGAVAAHIARYSPYADKFKVLVLESTFTSWRSIAKEVAASNFFTYIWQYPVSWSIPKEYSWSIPKEYSTIDNIKYSKIKNTIIIHSEADNLVKFDNGDAIYQMAHEPKIFLKDNISNHAQIMSNPRVRKEFLNALDTYLN